MDRKGWRTGQLTSIGDILDRNIILKGADVLTTKGYTMVPNHVLVSDRISPGAKLAYAMLLKYAWQNDYCFPGQERLASDMGVTRQSAKPTSRSYSAAASSTSNAGGRGEPTYMS